MRWSAISSVLLAGGMLLGIQGNAVAQVSVRVQLVWEWGADGTWQSHRAVPGPGAAYSPASAVVTGVVRPRVRVPPGHLPPPGLCRLWYPGRPPGHQPPPAPCGTLFRAYRQPGVVILGASGYRGPSPQALPSYYGSRVPAPAYGGVVDTHPGRGRGRGLR